MPVQPADIEQPAILPVSPQEAETLRSISQQTFTETFAGQNTEEDMRRYLEQQLSLPVLLSQIRNPGSRFFLAQAGQQTLGYLKVNFSTAQTELKDPAALEIERIYVLKQFQHQRIGGLLLNKAIGLARQAALRYVWLGVWEHNHTAIDFYKRRGFVEFDKHLFRLGADEQTDLLMKLTLT